MKFSHSIQLNGSPEWQELHKWVYLIEKAKLGLVTLPNSYREVDPAVFLTAVTPQLQKPTDDESSPLLGGSRRGSPMEPGIAASKERIETFFTEALDDQLEKIVNFYGRKEKELLTESLYFSGEISQYEGFDDIRSHPLGTSSSQYQRRSPIPNFDSVPESDGDSSSSSSFAHHQPPIILANGHSSYLLGGASTTSASYTFWNRPSNKVQRLKFRKQATSTFVALNDLHEYRELNHTGFSKILKKYEKVTGYRLKSAYMARVDACYPFTQQGMERLKNEVDRIVSLYARISTDNNVSQASSELKSHLREHVVWERNTIWRDMVQQERRLQSSVAEELAQSSDKGFFASIGAAVTSPNGVWGVGELSYFQKVEQQNCLAILALASALWAFEVLPLFVTALCVPLLLVTLRVMRVAVPTPDGGIEYIRLPAKDAAKRVFSDMFSPVIMLLLGGFSLAAALSKHHIAKGLASIVLDKAGSEPKYVLLANIFVSTFASMWISNVAAPVLCFSLIAPILRNLPSRSPYAKSLVLGIALAANVGGMASPISSPQNIIATDQMSPPITWFQWFAIALPVCAVIDFAIWVLLLLIYRPGAARGDTTVDPPEAFPHKANYFADNPITPTQWYILGVTALTIGLWCVAENVKWFVGDMGIIAIFPIVAFYGTGVLSKDDWNSQLWTVVILAMGGSALGKAVDSSGLLAEITSYIVPRLDGLTPFLCILLFSGVVLFVALFISHTVAALILLPFSPDPQPRMFVMAIALMCSGAMGLPVSSFPNMNAISLEDPTGEPWLGVIDFIKVGIPVSVVAWASILGVGYPVMAFIGFK
ncbi:SPX domain-containing protein [Chytridium lagenaria]|nr:SPX domain-containing protein [Chytridium lagenaria]